MLAVVIVSDLPSLGEDKAMSLVRKLRVGCMALPVLLIGACATNVTFNSMMYNLPGEVLRSSQRPTRPLGTAMEVAETLDAYVQPRFEILRDKGFGIDRIVYRKHAGIVQLKVDTPTEHALIANVNAANRDYAISLLHCAPTPPVDHTSKPPRLQLLYFNQHPIATDWLVPPTYGYVPSFDSDAVQTVAIQSLDSLMAGKEHRDHCGEWDLLMRPVLGSKPECLRCHRGATPGAPLGVMVYAVKRTVRPSDPARHK